MKRALRFVRWTVLALVVSVLAGCDDPQVYGSVGVSTGFGSWGGSGTRMHTSISIGGRIR
jgi:hypothetical protein